MHGWTVFWIMVIVAGFLYYKSSPTQKSSIQDSIKDFFDKLKDITQPNVGFNPPLNSSQGSTQSLGYPQKNFEYECQSNKDCLDYFNKGICDLKDGKCYQTI